MCYTAIPGTDPKIRVIRDFQPRQRKEVVSKPVISLMRRLHFPVRTDPVFSGERMSMSFQFINESRADRRFDHKRGRRMAKRQHKPD